MSKISAGTTTTTALVAEGDSTGQLVFQTNGTTTAMTIGTNQVVSLAQPLPVASGGTGTTSSAFVNLASNVTGTLPIANGGTGTTSTTFANLTTNVTGTLPIANGGTGTTSTTFANLTTNVTGTLPIANGGTGQTSLTANNIILGNGTSAVQFVAPGTSGNVLTSDGTTWTSGTTSVAGGGTGRTSLTSNNVILGNGTSAVNFVAPGTNGNVLTSNGTSWVSQAISAGGLTLIGSLTLGNSAQSISLPAGWNTTYKYLFLIYQGVYVSASGTASVYIRFNSDTGNKYSYSWIAFGLGTAQGSQSVMSGPSIGNNDSTSAFLQLQYFPSESSFYRMRVMGSVSINSRIYAYGGAYETTSAPSTFDWAQFAGPGYYLNGALTLYGAN